MEYQVEAEIRRNTSAEGRIMRMWTNLDLSTKAIILGTPVAVILSVWLTFSILPMVDGLMKGHEVQTLCPSFCDRCRTG